MQSDYTDCGQKFQPLREMRSGCFFASDTVNGMEPYVRVEVSFADGTIFEDCFKTASGRINRASLYHSRRRNARKIFGNEI